MASFGVLHLTDLHYGLNNQETLLPNIQADFFRDLEMLHRRSGPWDIVLFSGDLVQSGRDTQFVQFQKLLDELWRRLERFSSHNPILLAVPGNHDLARPDADLPEVMILEALATSAKRERVWEDVLGAHPTGRYRKVLDESFKAYRQWWDECPYSGKTRPELEYHEGLLPGDFSAVLEKEGARLGILGLNTTFLQITGGDYQGKLALDLRQFHAACQNKDALWFEDNLDACLLMTHQPPDWLADANRKEVFEAEIDLPGRFVAHFCGHMHVPDAQTRSSGWAQTRRLVRGGSLFGLETSDDGTRTERIHAYSACRIELPNGATRGNIRLWPRMATPRMAGHLEFDRDTAFSLDRARNDDGTRAEEFDRLRTPPSPLPPPASTPLSDATINPS